MGSQEQHPERPATRPKRSPRIIKYRNLLFITPAGTARMHANIILIKGETGNVTFVDCGCPIDPGNALLGQMLTKYGVARAPSISLLITHSHNDHVGNIWWFRSKYPQLQSYASEAESRFITFPLSSTPYWDRVNSMVGGTRASSFLRRIVMIGALPGMFGRFKLYNPVDFTFGENMTRLKVGGRVIQPIFTPGHSPGHCTYLDEAKWLFLGDLVPFTPWLDPDPSSLAHMIQSIEKILCIPDRKVEYVVRSHCNASDHGRFIYPWAEERARFQAFLDTIQATLDKIPAMLRGRVLSTFSIGQEIIKNMAKYSTFLSRLWLPPGMSWIVGYLGYLEQQGKIHRIYGFNQAAWSS